MLIKFNPSGKSITFVLSLASDKDDIVCTLQRNEAILPLPKVISFDTLDAVAAASCPMSILLDPVVKLLVPLSPALAPIQTLLFPVVILSPENTPSKELFSPVVNLLPDSCPIEVF